MTVWTTVTRHPRCAVSRPARPGGQAARRWAWLYLSDPLTCPPPQINTPAPRTGSSVRTTGASPTAGSVMGTTTVATARMNPMPPAQVWTGHRGWGDRKTSGSSQSRGTGPWTGGEGLPFPARMDEPTERGLQENRCSSRWRCGWILVPEIPETPWERESVRSGTLENNISNRAGLGAEDGGGGKDLTRGDWVMSSYVCSPPPSSHLPTQPVLLCQRPLHPYLLDL